jgi:PIN domain nuclease of toxin-antitoxin system
MRLLLDTHAFLWWLDGDRKLKSTARALIADESHTVLVSAASVWEITTKARIGKLPGALTVAADVAACIASQGFVGLAIEVVHAQRAGNLAGSHRDPFDRMLIAQSQCEDLPLVSNERIFDGFGIRRVW